MLRHASRELRATTRGRDLPDGVPAAVTRILDVFDHVLDRLEQLSERADDHIALPHRLAEIDGLLRLDLPECVRLYRERPRTTSPQRAAAALAEQLDVIAGAADRLAAESPDAGAERAEELTRDLRRRYR